MLQKIVAILVIGLFCAITQATAQNNYTILGNVQDEAHKPVDMATVVLHALPDSSVIKANYTDTPGTFRLDQLKGGNYFVEVIAQGYAVYQSNAIVLVPGEQSLTLPPITLYKMAKALDEVAITGRKQFVVQKADRMVVNVDAILSAAGGTALDVLEKCPGVQVTQDGAVSLKGKQNVMIFINDKPSYMSGDELANYLRSLPSSMLDQVELMSNPPAQYDAAGNAGIINIKMKRKGVKGFNGGVNLSANRGYFTRSNNSVNINYRNNKVSTYINAGYDHNEDFTDLKLNRTYLDENKMPISYFNQNSYFKRLNDGASVNAGADYSYSEKSVVGISVSGLITKGGSVNDNVSSLFDNNYLPDSSIVAQNNNKNLFRNGNINLNYRTKFKKDGHTLSADVDHIAYSSLTEQRFHNRGYSASGSLGMQDMLSGHLPSNIGIYAAKADYSLPFTTGWKFDAGAKASYTQTDNKAAYSITAAGATLPDYEKSNQFIYKENINAVYLNVVHDGKALSVQGGLRVENTVSNGHQLGNALKADSAFLRRYTNLFPTLFVTYKLDTQDKHVLNINFGRRIDRPFYQDLNPFVNPMDKFTYYVGNPFLRPSFNNSVSLAHIYKSKVNTSVTYSRSEDDVNETIEIADGIYYSRPGNLGSKTTLNVSMDVNTDIAKWLNIHVYTEYGNIQTRSNFYSGQLNTGGGYIFIGPTCRMKLGKGWDAELNAFYRSRIYDAQFIMNHLWQVSATVQKKINNSCNVKLGVRDIFYSQFTVGEIGNLYRATANWVNRRDSRAVVASFSYRFGKAFDNTARQKESSAESEKNRIKR